MKKTLLVILFFVAVLFIPKAEADIVSYDFDLMPGDQGWTSFLNNGDVSVDGTTLTINTMGNAGSAYAYYVMNNIVDPFLPFSISLTARVLESEFFVFQANGFGIRAYVDGYGAGFGLDSDQIGAGSQYWNYDTSEFHDYRVEATPGINYSLFIDNQLFASNLNWNKHIGNYLIFGEGSSGGNGHVEINSLVFSQVVTPEPASMLLFGVGGLALAAFKRKKKRV